MRSCERPRKRSASEALPSSVSNRYFLSIRTHGSSCRRRANSSLRRVSSFSALSSSSRAASHSSRFPVMCFVIAVSFLRVSIRFSIRLGGCWSRDKLSAGYRNDGSYKCGGIPMDSLITAAARALAAGDPLGALKRVALRDDAPALALRGIAMAQLGDLVRAKALLRSAARAFGPKEAVARARCVVAEAEIALVSRDLGWPAKALDPAPFPPASRTAHELVVAGIAMRRLRTKAARAALARAERAARHARIPALTSEVESAFLVLNTPAARLIASGEERLLLLEEVEALLASNAFVVDACRHAVRDEGTVVSLAKRPVLFTLARALGEAWPGDVPRDTLIARAFRAKLADESHRARLRVEVGRLRKVLRTLASVSATKRGFALAPRRAREVVVLARPVEEKHAAVLAFLADGESWSSSALALALGASQRTVQRALASLAAAGKVQSFGRGRARLRRGTETRINARSALVLARFFEPENRNVSRPREAGWTERCHTAPANV